MSDDFKNMTSLLIRSRDKEEYTVIEFNDPPKTQFAIENSFIDETFNARIIGEGIKVLKFDSYEDYEKNYLLKDEN